ncbi:helix-turn-helix transcriptional regulator [Spirillospora sp. NPDC052269]
MTNSRRKGPNPTAARRRLARAMRQLRDDAGIGREAAAKHAGIGPATLSRLEAGTHAPKPANVFTLCMHYGLDADQANAYAELARQCKEPSWWHRYNDVLPKGFDVFVGLEDEATRVQCWQPTLIDGRFQTADYMTALARAEIDVPQDQTVERLVSVRQQRQARLLDGSDDRDPAEIWSILHESTLRTMVGGRAVMKAQLDRLLELSVHPLVDLQVLPFAKGAHPCMQNGFHVLGFPDPADPETTYIEYRTGGIFLDDPDEVAIYGRIFDQLRARALDPDETRALITQTRDAM